MMKFRKGENRSEREHIVEKVGYFHGEDIFQFNF